MRHHAAGAVQIAQEGSAIVTRLITCPLAPFKSAQPPTLAHFLNLFCDINMLTAVVYCPVTGADMHAEYAKMGFLAAMSEEVWKQVGLA